MDRSHWIVRKFRVKPGEAWPDEASEPPGGELSMAEKLKLAWPLVMEAYGFRDPNAPECRLQRQVVRLTRRGS